MERTRRRYIVDCAPCRGAHSLFEATSLERPKNERCVAAATVVGMDHHSNIMLATGSPNPSEQSDAEKHPPMLEHRNVSPLNPVPTLVFTLEHSLAMRNDELDVGGPGGTELKIVALTLGRAALV